MKEDVGNILRHARLAKEMTQEKLALASGIPRRTLQDYEHGKGGFKISTLEKLSDALGLDIRLLIRAFVLDK